MTDKFSNIYFKVLKPNYVSLNNQNLLDLSQNWKAMVVVNYNNIALYVFGSINFNPGCACQ